MTMIDSRQTTHPIWCHRRDRSECLPPEPLSFGEHRGQELSLDCGEHFQDTVTVTLAMWSARTLAGEQENSYPRIALGVIMNDFENAAAVADLTPAEARRLIQMLSKAIDDAENYSGLCAPMAPIGPTS